MRLFLFLLILTAFFSLAKADGDVRFNRDIRPILSENCFHCHGPDENAREAGLRLDTQADAHEYAISPGEPADSEVVFRITSDDPDLVMPPADSERSLAAEQIELLTRWIDQGARYQSHWSFVPPIRPSVPTAKGPSRVVPVQPIDRFVRQQLDDFNRERGHAFQPAAETDRETLIRRVTFTLTGLPPTLEQIDTFLADESPGAYERLVDRLLQSPAFGERMAADWLDVARYSDTYGYQVDRDRFVWPWRDWVIDAFNRNLPYDQFIVQQLAGDLLPNTNRDQILATTFNRLHPQKVEGGSVPEEFRMEYVADRTQTVGTAFMGLTMECCRCHSHKYDPISHSEYYQLSAFFDNIDEAGLYSYFTDSVPTPTLTLPTDAQHASLITARGAVAEAEAKLNTALSEQGAENGGLRFTSPVLQLDFEDLSPDGANRPVEGVFGKAALLSGDDAIDTDAGNFRRYQPFSISLWIKTPERENGDPIERAVIFHRSRAWTDAGSRGYQLLINEGKLSWSLIHFWPGNAIRVRTKQPIADGQWLHVTASYDGSSRAEGLAVFLNGVRAPTDIVRDSLSKTITGGGQDTIAIGQRFRDRGFTQGAVDRFQVFDCQLSELEIQGLADATGQLADADFRRAYRAEFDPEMIAEHLRFKQSAEVIRLTSELKQARAELCDLEDSIQEIMVMRELPEPRPSYRLERGDYSQRAEQVGPGTPAALTPFPEDLPRNRLGLARWLTSPEHPLTSRVAVNRLWQICFGTGLVRTPEDFGSQGQPPTHPELLDWLAVDFVEGGWNIKRMLKQIVMSASFRQSSALAGGAELNGAAPEDGVKPPVTLAEIDPENRLLAHFPAHRLSAEMLRDNALAVSGRLVKKIGGPPVKPYEIEASFKPQDRDQGEGLYRRSLYTYWKRTAPAPVMMTLNASKRDVCRVRRERVSSPLQAFVLLNGPQFVEAARGLAERLLREHPDAPHAILHDGFRILTSKTPSESQMNVLERLRETQQEYFQGYPARAEAYLTVGEAAVDQSLDPVQLAATTVVIATLMNLDASVMNR